MTLSFQWFGYYPENNSSYVLDIKQTDLYKDDKIGLKTLKESNRLKFVAVDGDHLQIPHDVFVNDIIKPYLAQ